MLYKKLHLVLFTFQDKLVCMCAIVSEITRDTDKNINIKAIITITTKRFRTATISHCSVYQLLLLPHSSGNGYVVLCAK